MNLLFFICAATKTGGFTYHEKTPLITSHQINPAEHEDDEVFLETANVETINQQINQCQSNVVNICK